MSKIVVNLRDLKDAINNYDLISYGDDPANFNVEIEVVEGNDPGDGRVVDSLVISLDKKEKDYSKNEVDVKKTIEIFPHDKDLDARVTVQKTTVVKRNRKDQH